MATEQYANNAQSTLTAALTSAATSLTVASAAAFPASGNFRLLIDSEILLVTAVAGNTFTVSRGQEGTTAAAHANAAYVTQVLTAAALLNCPRSMTAAGDLEYLAAGGAVTRLGVGSAGQVLTVSGGLPSWQAAAGGGGGGDMLVAATNADATLTNADGNAAYDTWTVVKATTGARTVTLPAPALGSGKRQFVAVQIDPGSTKLVTLSAHAGENIGPGAATSRVMWAGESAILETDGTNWFKVAGLTIPMVAMATKAANQAVASGVETKINVDTATIDNTGLMVDTTNLRLNFQRGGVYFAVTAIRWYALSAGGARAAGYAYKNGSLADATFGVGESEVAAGGLPATSGISIATLSAGDYAELYAFQNTGASQSAYGGSGPRYCYFYAQEIPSW